VEKYVLIHSVNYSEDAAAYHQIELPIKKEDTSEDKISEIHVLLENQTRAIEQQQINTQALSDELAEAIIILYQLQGSDPTESIEAVKQEVKALSEGVMKIYYHLDEDNIGKELKAGQQNLQKVIASAIEANQKKTTHNVGFLDWKQIATIITATAVISSLCSLAVFQVASNLKTDQKIPIPTEKPLKPKIKKIPQ
jgi:hypothetical protein